MALGNQTLGRGQVHLSLFKAGGNYIPDGFRYVGNTPDLSLSIGNEKLDHFSSDQGIRVKDKTVILQTDATGSLTMDDIQPENLALFFFGSNSEVSQGAASGLSETFTAVTQGLSYQVGISNARPMGYHSLLTVVVKVGASTKTINTDYTVDVERGIVTPLVGGSITTGSDMIVEFAVAAKKRQVIISGAAQVEAAMRFISYNPQGEKFDYYFPYVKLSPNGDFQLKADEWQQLPFTLEILQAPNKAAIYCNGLPY